MNASSDKDKDKKIITEITTVPVPFPLEKIEENITITSNSEYQLSKEKLIKQAFKFHSQGNISRAKQYYLSFINQGYLDHRVFSNYGTILRSFGKLKEAEVLYRKAIEISPNFVEAYYNLGLTLKDLGELKDAELSTRKAIELNPNSSNTYLNLGIILRDLGNLKDAELSTRKAIELNPNSSNAYLNLGATLRDLGNLKDAELFTRKAIELNPNFEMAYSNLGNILIDLGNLEEAKLYTRKSIELNPNSAESHSNMGLIMKNIGYLNEAIYHYNKAIKINKKLSVAKSGLIESKGLICDWSDQRNQKLWIDKLGIYESSINPLSLFYYEDNPLKQLKRSKRFYKENFIHKTYYLESFKNKKIHIGYFSADFNNHATMYLIASILELHDKSKFEIYLYSFTPIEDNYTERAKKSGCFFRDIRKLNTNESVELARKDKLDIAVDLKGYTQHCRMSIFSHRVASIQINYLGYPGSLGADCIDYIIADRITIPEGYEKFYSEKVIRMPNCYQCNDNKKEVSRIDISRGNFNLPEKGIVFTCFNANKKITSKEFDIWMRLLNKVKGSVLWLYKSNKYSLENLKNEAIKRNIDPKRLIFAHNLPLNEHLSRHTLGDLALDTFNYNGHTTTSDALWAGLPVLTKIGESFAARVSASILTSIGLPELITYSEKEYEEKALNIATNPNELIRLKSKLNRSIKTSSLYNSKLFTKDLETTYMELIKINLNKPSNIK